MKASLVVCLLIVVTACGTLKRAEIRYCDRSRDAEIIVDCEPDPFEGADMAHPERTKE